MRPVPVTVVTGFLGAGKTTLLNRWLAGRRDASVIVNEVGAVGIDGELLAAPARDVLEISGGCICCTTQAELVAALARLSESSSRIFVETSGAASPAGVVRAIARNESLELEGVVTVVDGTRLAALAAIDLAAEQIGYADVLVVTRACSEATRAELARRNATAVITESPESSTETEDLDRLLARRSADFVGPLHSNVNHGIESIALELEGAVDEERFGAWVENELSQFASRLLRVKGILAVSGVEGRMILQGVADRLSVSFSPGTARSSRMVVIGFGLDRDAIERGFRETAEK